MEWLEITANTSHERLQELENRLIALDVSGFITEDARDVSEFLENNRKYWDYVDEAFLQSMQGVCRVKFYLEDSEAGRTELRRIERELPEWELTARAVRDEDWENNWKAYYKPIPVGERLVIVPEWEDVPSDAGRLPLRLDPGLIFGTGSHATTQLCLEELERVVQPGDAVLDLGCGSGILAIGALLLGAERAVGCDIDEKAPDVVTHNASLNGIGSDRLGVFCGDVLSDRALRRRLGAERFRLVLSNIVADVVIALSERVPELLAPDGVYICSGVIDGREDEVEAALKRNGFVTERHRHKDNWHAFTCVRREN